MDQQLTNNQNINKYFAMIPHMADDDLDPYEYRLYGHYIRVCGKTGTCWESAETTAKLAKMSAGKVSECRLVLAQKGYITMNEKPNNGGYDITIVDRMAENVARYSPSPNEGGASHSEGKASPHEAKKNQSRKTNEEESTSATNGAKKSRKRNLLFDAIREHLLDSNVPNSEVGKVKKSLKEKYPHVSDDDLADRLLKWIEFWKQTYSSDIHLPRALEKILFHFNKWYDDMGFDLDWHPHIPTKIMRQEDYPS